MDVKKLTAEELMNRTRKLKIDIKDHSDIGSVHFKVNGVYANLRVPSLIDPVNERSMLIKFDSMNEKAAFTFDDTELREQSVKLTEPHKYDSNYILLEKGNDYQVFIRQGVVVYLTDEEVDGLYAIFSEVKKYLMN